MTVVDTVANHVQEVTGEKTTLHTRRRRAGRRTSKREKKKNHNED